jgi:hypothetical protein
MKLRFTPRAVQDLAAIAYRRAQSPGRSARAFRHPSFVAKPDPVPTSWPSSGDLAREEVVIVTIQHPAREREYEDA